MHFRDFRSSLGGLVTFLKLPPNFGELRGISWRQLFAVFGGPGSSPSIHSCGEVHIPFENRGFSGDFGEFWGYSGNFGGFRGISPILGVLGILVRFWLEIFRLAWKFRK